MIETEQHAQAVQQRRYDAGKHGIAKAVRRYFKHRAGKYDAIRKLPARWPQAE